MKMLWTLQGQLDCSYQVDYNNTITLSSLKINVRIKKRKENIQVPTCDNN